MKLTNKNFEICITDGEALPHNTGFCACLPMADHAG